MKKIVSLLIIALIITCSIVPAYAAEFSQGALSINIPDNLIEDKALAAEYDMTNSWITEDENFAFDISIEENDDNYTYVNYTEKEIQNIYDDYVEGDEEYYTLDKGENITVGGFEGIRLDMSINYDGYLSKHVVCAFSTKTDVYTLYFYIYDESYSGYVDEIINSVVIDGNSYDAEKESNIQYLIYLAVVLAISVISSLVKKSKAKKKASAAMNQPTPFVPTEEAVNANAEPETNNYPETAQDISEIHKYPVAPSEDFASKEAERERKEREKMFD